MISGWFAKDGLRARARRTTGSLSAASFFMTLGLLEMAGLDARERRTSQVPSCASSSIHSGFIPRLGWLASSSSLPDALRLVSSIRVMGSIMGLGLSG